MQRAIGITVGIVGVAVSDIGEVQRRCRRERSETVSADRRGVGGKTDLDAVDTKRATTNLTLFYLLIADFKIRTTKDSSVKSYRLNILP